MSPRRVPVGRSNRAAKPPLNREGIVTVALQIMHEEAFESVTMRRLAAEFQTGPASIYVYIANVAELRGAILDRLLGGLDLNRQATSETAREVLIGLLADYIGMLLGPPSLARAVLVLWPSGPNYLKLIDNVLALLLLDGVPPRQAAWGVDQLLQHATATAAEHGTRVDFSEGERDGYRLRSAIEEATAEDYPAIAKLRGELFSGTPGQRLRWQLTALIEGIAGTAVPV
jgi:AcrR family transcriptional regulator